MGNDNQTKIEGIPDNWENPQKILVVLAHPDDPEFFCGASIARWTLSGHDVVYCLLTCGDKGTKDRSLSSDILCGIRQKEQKEAAAVLGVRSVLFLDYPDGFLLPNIELRRDITRVIRQVKPDILVTCDPTTYYFGDSYLNHPDHRAAGQAALDAVYPAARDHLTFLELWQDESLEPHNVRELWICGTKEPNITLDVTTTWETKIQALYKHKTQIGDPEKLADRMHKRRTEDSTDENPRYVEKYRRILFS